MKCAVCGKDNRGVVEISGVSLCKHPCAQDVQVGIDRIRAEGGRPNAAGIARQLYRERQGTLDQYSLRDIPGDLWKRAKIRAVEDGTDLRAVILKALEEYLA